MSVDGRSYGEGPVLFFVSRGISEGFLRFLSHWGLHCRRYGGRGAPDTARGGAGLGGSPVGPYCVVACHRRFNRPGVWPHVAHRWTRVRRRGGRRIRRPNEPIKWAADFKLEDLVCSQALALEFHTADPRREPDREDDL